MDERRIAMHLFSLALLIGAAGCGERSGAPDGAGVAQTRFPGQMTAGGGTSGEVIAQASSASTNRGSSGTPGIPQGSGGNVGGAAMGSTRSEGTRGQVPGGSVSGTPSIPEGAGGTTSGAAMGGTTPGAAASQATPEPQRSPSGSPAPQGKQ